MHDHPEDQSNDNRQSPEPQANDTHSHPTNQATDTALSAEKARCAGCRTWVDGNDPEAVLDLIIHKLEHHPEQVTPEQRRRLWALVEKVSVEEVPSEN